MSQTAKAQEPSMEEILASIRRIIADDGGGKPNAAEPPPPAAPRAAEPAPRPAEAVRPAPEPRIVPPPEPAAMSQADIDAVLADFDSPGEAEPPLVLEPAELRQDDSVDVLELTEAMEVRPVTIAAERFRKIDASPDVVFSEAEEPVAAAPPRDGNERSLLSDNANAAVTRAFGSLAHTVLSQNARTLDDLVKDMLRPMLKSWLDDNLPTIVERLVRAEIERVSRGR